MVQYPFYHCTWTSYYEVGKGPKQDEGTSLPGIWMTFWFDLGTENAWHHSLQWGCAWRRLEHSLLCTPCPLTRPDWLCPLWALDFRLPLSCDTALPSLPTTPIAFIYDGQTLFLFLDSQVFWRFLNVASVSWSNQKVRKCLSRVVQNSAYKTSPARNTFPQRIYPFYLYAEFLR